MWLISDAAGVLAFLSNPTPQQMRVICLVNQHGGEKVREGERNSLRTKTLHPRLLNPAPQRLITQYTQHVKVCAALLLCNRTDKQPRDLSRLFDSQFVLAGDLVNLLISPAESETYQMSLMRFLIGEHLYHSLMGHGEKKKKKHVCTPVSFPAGERTHAS